MASDRVVKRTLESIASMHGKGRWWIDDSMKMWKWQLRDVRDQDLIIGCRDLLRKTKTLPTVAQLLEVMEASPATSVGDAPLILGCPACDNTGMREMSRWYTRRGKLTVLNCMAACDCPSGLVLESGAYVSWLTIKQRWEDDKWTKDIHHATHQQPHLTTQQRMTPDQIAMAQAKIEDGKAKKGSWDQLMDKT